VPGEGAEGEMKFQRLDDDHYLINDYLLDFNLVWAWYNVQTFPSHDPITRVRQAQRDIKYFAQTNDRPDWVHWNLMMLNDIGYRIPDQAFAEYPWESYFYRDDNSELIGYGELTAKAYKKPRALGVPTLKKTK
jgi:hypothetical protein